MTTHSLLRNWDCLALEWVCSKSFFLIHQLSDCQKKKSNDKSNFRASPSHSESLILAPLLLRGIKEYIFSNFTGAFDTQQAWWPLYWRLSAATGWSWCHSNFIMRQYFSLFFKIREKKGNYHPYPVVIIKYVFVSYWTRKTRWSDHVGSCLVACTWAGHRGGDRSLTVQDSTLNTQLSMKPSVTDHLITFQTVMILWMTTCDGEVNGLGRGLFTQGLA